MNITETLLKNLNGGQLQRLALELLPKINSGWTDITPFGACEGGERTRKGTPDIWCKNSAGNYVYIQATGDPAKGKMYEDTEKSVNKLVDLNKVDSAECISFLNYDPDSEEVEKCKNLCIEKKCSFKYYNNNSIAKILDENFPEIKHYIFNEYFNDRELPIDLTIESFREKVDYIFGKNKWCEDEMQTDLVILIKELILNSFEHGVATTVQLVITNNYISIIDNGVYFDLTQNNFEEKSSRYSGGKFAMDYFINNYNNEISFKCYRVSDKNIYKFMKVYNDQYVIKVSNECSIDIDFHCPKNKKFDIHIPEHCDDITIVINDKCMMLSDFVIIIRKTILGIPNKYKIKVKFTQKTSSMFQRLIIMDEILNKRVEFI